MLRYQQANSCSYPCHQSGFSVYQYCDGCFTYINLHIFTYINVNIYIYKHKTVWKTVVLPLMVGERKGQELG